MKDLDYVDQISRVQEAISAAISPHLHTVNVELVPEAAAEVDRALELAATAEEASKSESDLECYIGSLATCLADSLCSRGEAGQLLWSELLLGSFPRLAALAARSAAAVQPLMSLAALAAASSHCAPRELLLALLAALDLLCCIPGPGPPPPGLSLCNQLLELLPRVLRRIRPARAAAELPSAARQATEVAVAQGAALWAMAAAGADADEVAAARAQAVQLHTSFVQEALTHLGSSLEPCVLQACRQVLSAHLLAVLLHLAAAGGGGLTVSEGGGGCGAGGGTPPSAAGDQGGRGCEGLGIPVLPRLLALLRQCGVDGWPVLLQLSQDEQLPEATQCGAALAALASISVGADHHLEGPPRESSDIVLAACELAKPLVEYTSRTRHAAALTQVFQLLAAAGRAATGAWQLQAQGGARPPSDSGSSGGSAAASSGSCATSGSGNSSGTPGAGGVPAAGGGDGATSAVAGGSSQPAPGTGDATAEQQLLTRLASTVAMLSPASAFGATLHVRRAAQHALAALLDGLPPPLRLRCLAALLGEQHPEVCALLLQRLRQELVGSCGVEDTPVPGGSARQDDIRATARALALQWLAREGPRGWRDVEGLVGQANAVCAALNLLRYELLRAQQLVLREGGGAAGCGVLPELLVELAGAVQQGVSQYQGAATAGAQPQGPPLAAAASGQPTAAGAGGPVGGHGTDVDAALALSRVQVVLMHVQELVGSCEAGA